MGVQSAGIDLDLREEKAIVKPWGVLDIGGSEQIRPLMDAAMNATVNHFLFDLERVSFLDGSGVQELVRFNATAQSRGKRVSIINGHPQVRRVFSLTGSSRVLDLLC